MPFGVEGLLATAEGGVAKGLIVISDPPLLLLPMAEIGPASAVAAVAVAASVPSEGEIK